MPGEAARVAVEVMRTEERVCRRAADIVEAWTAEALKWARIGDRSIFGVLFLLPFEEARGHAHAIQAGPADESDLAIEVAARAQATAFHRLLQGGDQGGA